MNKENKVYSGDFEWVNGQLDIRNRSKKNSKCYSCKDFRRLIKHIIDNTKRTKHKEKIIHNELREDIKIVNGNPKETYKDFKVLIELEKQQDLINKNHHRRKEDNVLDWGRGERIPARLGVSQLLLNPRHPDNQDFINDWEIGVSDILINEFGKDTDIVFHYNETSAGVHFIRKYYKFIKDKDGNVIKAVIDKEKCKNDLSQEKLKRVHDKIEKLVEELSKKHNKTFKQEAGTIKSVERDIRTKNKVVDKLSNGEKLSQAEKSIVERIVDNKEIKNRVLRHWGKKENGKFVSIEEQLKQKPKAETKTEIKEICKEQKLEELNEWGFSCLVNGKHRDYILVVDEENKEYVKRYWLNNNNEWELCKSFYSQKVPELNNEIEKELNKWNKTNEYIRQINNKEIKAEDLIKDLVNQVEEDKNKIKQIKPKSLGYTR